MPNDCTVYHVVGNAQGDEWVVSQENNLFRQKFQTKDEAVAFANERAQKQESSHVKVHTRGGGMEYENTYGEDRGRPAG